MYYPQPLLDKDRLLDLVRFLYVTFNLAAFIGIGYINISMTKDATRYDSGPVSSLGWITRWRFIWLCIVDQNYDEEDEDEDERGLQSADIRKQT